MASIEKRLSSRGSATYIVKYREPDGRHRTKGGFQTKRAASSYATTVEAKLLAGETPDPHAGKLLFRDVAQTYLASRPDLKETTRAAYAEALAPAKKTGPTAKRHKRLAELRIDAVFGGYPINAIKREHVAAWVGRMHSAGKGRSTIRNALFLLRAVLRFAADEKWVPSNPAADVKLPRGSSARKAGVVDDPAQFLTPDQVATLAAATPWPYNVMVSVAAWSGLRAGELAGLQVGDVVLPKPGINPNAAARSGELRVERALTSLGGKLTYIDPKTQGSRRKVPITLDTTALLRDYLAVHPRSDDPTAPLFPGMALRADRPTGVRATPADDEATARDGKAIAARQALALAGLSVDETEARLALDWDAPVRHATFYKAVYRPAILRANRLAAATGVGPVLEPQLTFHALRHTYASICVAAGLDYMQVCRFMGHAKPTTTLSIYTHLFNHDDHAGAMTALGAMAARPAYTGNVVPLRR